MSDKKLTEIVTVKSPEKFVSRQKNTYFIGISSETTGATGISMNMVVIPPGATAAAHTHKDFETGIYVLKGRVETRYGHDLEHSVVNEAGDFVFIPPDLPHQPTNLSSDEPAQAIVVRNDPNEHENVVLHDQCESTPMVMAQNFSKELDNVTKLNM